MRKEIQETKTFKSLSKIQKDIYGKRKVIQEIEDQFIVAKNKGVDQWLNDFKPISIYKNIITELLKNIK